MDCSLSERVCLRQLQVGIIFIVKQVIRETLKLFEIVGYNSSFGCDHLVLTFVLACGAWNNPFSQEFFSHCLWHTCSSSSGKISPLFSIIVSTDSSKTVVIPG